MRPHSRLARETPFDRGLDAFLLTILIALSCLPFFNLLSIPWPSFESTSTLLKILKDLGLGLLFLLLTSLVYGWLYSQYLSWNRGPNLQWVDIVDQYASNHWVLVHFTDEVKILGWIDRWGKGKDDHVVLFLNDAKEYNKEGMERTIPSPGVLITLDERVSRVEFDAGTTE